VFWIQPIVLISETYSISIDWNSDSELNAIHDVLISIRLRTANAKCSLKCRMQVVRPPEKRYFNSFKPNKSHYSMHDVFGESTILFAVFITVFDPLHRRHWIMQMYQLHCGMWTSVSDSEFPDFFLIPITWARVIIRGFRERKKNLQKVAKISNVFWESFRDNEKTFAKDFAKTEIFTVYEN
jgi:hypothetical protein